MLRNLRQTKPYRLAYRWYRRQDWLGAGLLILSRYHIRQQGLHFYVRTLGMTNAFKASFWFDRYETGERALVRKYVHPDHPVIELGGGIGMIACVANRQLNIPENHIVVEANPALIEVIERNKALNGSKFQIMCAAYAAVETQVTFDLSRIYTINHVISGSAQHEVRGQMIVCSGENLQRLIEKSVFTGVSLICDIEGSEYDLIDYEAEVLRQHVHTFVVEMHNPPPGKQLEDYVRQLNSIGFELIEQAQRVYVFVKQPVHEEGNSL